MLTTIFLVLSVCVCVLNCLQDSHSMLFFPLHWVWHWCISLWYSNLQAIVSSHIHLRIFIVLIILHLEWTWNSGNLMSVGFILQEQKTGMHCCPSGLPDLFSGLLRTRTLQPYDPSFCQVQFICVCIIGVMLVGYVLLTLHSLVSCVTVYYRVFVCVPKQFALKVITRKTSTWQAIYAVTLSL